MAMIGNSILMGVGLSMDAFSVSVVQGLTDQDMKRKKAANIAAVFAFFQFLMPVIGWVCVHAAAMRFAAFEKIVPWIALILLVLIGINMIREGIAGKKHAGEDVSDKTVAGSKKVLLLQGIATSIDALAVGFAFASYSAGMALLASLIIGIVTFVICCFGVEIGVRIGKRLAVYAPFVGGIILIVIGIEIFVRGI